MSACIITPGMMGVFLKLSVCIITPGMMGVFLMVSLAFQKEPFVRATEGFFSFLSISDAAPGGPRRPRQRPSAEAMFGDI